MDAGLSVELILWLKENPPHPFQNTDIYSFGLSYNTYTMASLKQNYYSKPIL